MKNQKTKRFQIIRRGTITGRVAILLVEIFSVVSFLFGAYYAFIGGVKYLLYEFEWYAKNADYEYIFIKGLAYIAFSIFIYYCITRFRRFYLYWDVSPDRRVKKWGRKLFGKPWSQRRSSQNAQTGP